MQKEMNAWERRRVPAMTTFVLSALLNIPLQSKIRAFNYSLQLAANRLNVRLRNRNFKKRTNCTYRRKI